MNSNTTVEDVEAQFDALFAGFGFTADSNGGQNLGDECAGIVAESIAADASDHKGADGQDFPENSEPYRTRKSQKYGWTEPGKRTGQTLSLASLKGTPEITADEVNMTYGLDEPPARSAAPTGYMSDADGNVTDREKAGWLTDKFGPIYAMNEKRSEAVAGAVAEGFGKFADNHFNGKS